MSENNPDSLRQVVALLQDIANSLSVLTAAEKRRMDRMTRLRERKRGPNNDTKLIVDMVRKELLARGNKPAYVHVLYERIKAKGVEVQGKDPVNSLRTMLWRDPAFITTSVGCALAKQDDLVTETFIKGA